MEELGAFGNVFILIDDLTVLNICDEPERSFWEIYPTELELKKENLGYLEESFLALISAMKDKEFYCLI